MARPGSRTSEPAPNGLVLSSDRPAEAVAFESEVVGFFVDAAGVLGVPRSVAAVYGVVFASPAPLTFSEVEQRLSISKGSVSQGLKVLREIGAIKEANGDEAPASGARAGGYVPDMELRKLVARFLENRLRKQLEGGRERLDRIAKSVPTGHPAQAKELRTRLKHLQNWHSKTRSLLPLAHTVLKLGS